MSNQKPPSIIRIYSFATLVSASLVAFVGFKLGIAALFLVLVLAALEITFSVDNAVINTRVLEKMSNAWQQAFLTIGILIAVFGVRVILPLYIVSLATGLSMGSTLDLALNNPEEYGHRLEDSHIMIGAFGGTFLLMIFLDFFFQNRQTKWLKGIETTLQQVGKLESMSVVIALAALLGVSSFLEGEERQTALLAGVFGLLIYLIINSLDTLLEKSNVSKNLQKSAQNTFKAGLIGFLYLNVIDASFSLDGVIGAFAITNQILLIAVGLGVGALYVRVITIHMLRHKVLNRYRFMEHGAHYAIGILAVMMLASLKIHIPEAVTGLAGVAFVTTAVVHSYLLNKKESKTA
jgi:uncharacterized protein